MENSHKEFVMEMFLDSDSIFSINRLMVATTNVIADNSKTLTGFTKLFAKEYQEMQNVFPERAPTSTCTNVAQKRDYENIVNSSDSDYYATFKMKKRTVQALLKYLRDVYKPTSAVVTLDQKLHIFLLLLTSDSSFGEIAKLFDLHKSTVSYIFHEVASLLADQKQNFIVWPSVEEQHITRIKVNGRYNLPNCVGFIDACRFHVGSKKKRREQLDVVLLQAVCDESLAFIDIEVGDVGVKKKSKIFKDCWLQKELKKVVDFDNHLLGDTEYKLRMNLITPFSSKEVLTSEEMNFNDRHWNARSYIYRAFELLKDKFQKLNHIDINKPEAVQTLLCAACVLHNFILLHEGSPNIKDEPVICDDGVTIDPDIVKTAEEKRQFLCNYVNFIESN